MGNDCLLCKLQSHVTAHAELAWLLQCYTPIGWLRKMIQFKTKSEKQVGCKQGEIAVRSQRTVIFVTAGTLQVLQLQD